MLHRLFLILFCLINVNSFAQTKQNFDGVINVDGFNYYAKISPNERYIAFIKMSKQEQKNVDYDEDIYGDIWLYDSQTDSIEQLTRKTYHSKSYDNYISWSPRSDKIYFSAGGSIFEFNIQDYKAKILLKTDLGKDHRTVFAPSTNTDGSKLAYWVMKTENNSNITHGINYLDLATGKEFELAKKVFDPGTEVDFYNPQWAMNDSKILATFFNPEDEIQLCEIEVHSKQIKVLDQNLYTTFFKVKKDNVYYTKHDINKKESVLYKTDLTGNKKELLRVNQDAVFDVGDKGIIYFSRNDSTFEYRENNNKISFLAKGSSPTVQGNKLVLEKWLGTGLRTKLLKMIVNQGR